MQNQYHQIAVKTIPRDSWWLGNLPSIQKDFIGFIDRMGKVSSFTKCHIFRKPAYFVSEPSLVTEILNDKNGVYVRSKFFTERTRRLFGYGLLTAEGEQWKHLRKMSVPAFQPKSTNTYLPIIREEVAHLSQDWEQTSNRNILLDMSTITARIITRCIFGFELEASPQDLENSLSDLTDVAMERIRYPINTPDWLPLAHNRRYRRAIDKFNDFIMEHIQNHVDNPDTTKASLLADLIAATENGGQSSYKELRDQIVTLFLAGHDTTANTLSFTLMILSQEIEWADRLKQEVRGFNFANIQNLNDFKQLLPLTYNVIRESMRLYPTAYALSRTTNKATVLAGEKIKKDSIIYISPYVSHRNPNVFVNPEQFNPDRWLNLQVDRSVYFPFSSGPRTCVGEYLAMLESCMLLAELVSKFDIETGKDPITTKASITLRPTNNLATKVIPVPLSSTIDVNKDALDTSI